MKQLMQTLNEHPMHLLAGACSLGLILSLSQASVAQQAVPAAAPAAKSFTQVPFSSLGPGALQTAAKPAAEEEQESPRPSKPGHEGVKVHGHWVLQVKNADGSLGERREFENSLVTTTTLAGGVSLAASGAQLMVGLLSGNLTPGDPGIGFIQGNVSGDPSLFCLTYSISSTPPTYCYVFTSANSLWNIGSYPDPSTSFVQSSLGLSYTAYFSTTPPLNPGPQIILSGNYTVPTGLTSIAAVQTLYGVCLPSSVTYETSLGTLASSATFRNADFPSVGCTTKGSSSITPGEESIRAALTSTTVTSSASGSPVATPLAVTPGQVVQVTVTLSFS